MPIAIIESLDNEGRGIARSPEGKAVFIEGALPGEEIEYTVFRKKKTYEQAHIGKIIRASAQSMDTWGSTAPARAPSSSVTRGLP